MTIHCLYRFFLARAGSVMVRVGIGVVVVTILHFPLANFIKVPIMLCTDYNLQDD